MPQDTSNLIVAVLAERGPLERRVAMVPTDAGHLASKVGLFVESGAGVNAGFPDIAYETAGAQIVDRLTVFSKADLVISVGPPEDVDELRSGTILVSLGGRDESLAEALEARAVVHLGLERLPRIARAQSMDVLSSQASIAGYAAVLEGARNLNVLLPMMTTAAGSIRPAKMIALGAGVAGLQAIATARRLGAVAHGFDVREAAREQVESLGAKFVFPIVDLVAAEAAGGYASEQSIDQQAKLRRALTEPLTTMQLIVASAQIPGKRAPILIDEATVAALQPGTVIVDLAAETGGNCVYTQPDRSVLIDGVRILGPTNLPSQMASDASRFFSRNVRALLEHIINKDGELAIDHHDAITGALIGRVSSSRSIAAFA